MNVMDAEWTPAEVEMRERRAEAYTRKCSRRRRAKSRQLTAFVRRLLIGSALFFSGAVAVALLWG